MGHRANYVIRENGQNTLYYSHWGALTVPEDVFWGPVWAEAFIVDQEVVDNNDWLDDVWGEGGVALNKDAKSITLFGGEALGYPPLQPYFLDLMSALWKTAGWSVQWADVGMPAIAAAVEVDPTVATAEPIPPHAADLQDIGADIYDPESEEFRISCLVTLVRDDGSLDHRVSDVLASGMLANGPEVLPVLESLPTLDEIAAVWVKPEYFGDEAWSFGDEFSASMTVNPTSRTIDFRELYANRSAVGFLSTYWKHWEMKQYEGDICEHFDRLGIATPDALVSESPATLENAVPEIDDDEALQQIAEALLSNDRANPAEMVRDMVDQEDYETVWVNPHAVRDAPVPILDDETRNKIFGQALVVYVTESEDSSR